MRILFLRVGVQGGNAEIEKFGATWKARIAPVYWRARIAPVYWRARIDNFNRRARIANINRRARIANINRRARIAICWIISVSWLPINNGWHSLLIIVFTNGWHSLLIIDFRLR